MFTLDSFWEALVDQGILNYDEMGRAQARFAQMGGGLDTCIIEAAILPNEAWTIIMDLASELTGLPVAPAGVQDAPDLEALATLSRDVLNQVRIVPSIDHDGQKVWIVPPVQPSTLAELSPLLRSRNKTYLAREMDLWMTLNQVAGIETPDRFLALWRGDIPSLMDGQITASPMPIPRSTEFVPELDTLGDNSLPTDENYLSLPNNTQPSTPSALGLAETADFETEEIQNFLNKKRLDKLFNSSNAMHKLGSLTSDVPKVRQATPTAPPQ
ncbi:MAG: hypothetical protein ACPGQS_13035 [Bradymonadia bacterium]